MARTKVISVKTYSASDDNLNLNEIKEFLENNNYEFRDTEEHAYGKIFTFATKKKIVPSELSKLQRNLREDFNDKRIEVYIE